MLVPRFLRIALPVTKAAGDTDAKRTDGNNFAVVYNTWMNV